MKQRLDRGTTVLAAALLLAYASVSDAQDTRTRPTTGANADRPAGSQAQPPANAQGMRFMRASDVIGMDVRNSKGDNLGDVKDVVVDVDTGRVAYAVVGIGGFLGIGEKLSAFPMSSFKMVQASDRANGTARGGRALDNDGVKGDRGPIGSDRTPAEARQQGRTGVLDNDGVKGDKGRIGSDRPTAGAQGTTDRTGTAAAPTTNRMLSGRGVGGTHLVLDADPQRLKTAPNFDAKQWPDWNDTKYRGEIDRAAGVNAAGAKGGHLVRASQLLDADIRDPQRKNVGEIEDLVIDTRTGQVQYAVVDFDQSWTPDDKLVAVPLRALRTAGGKGELVYSGDKGQLERAPAFDKGKWPDLNSGTFRSSVDRYMSSWSTAPAARSGSAAPGTGMTSAPTDRSGGTTAARTGTTGGSRTTEATPATGTPGTSGTTSR